MAKWASISPMTISVDEVTGKKNISFKIRAFNLSVLNSTFEILYILTNKVPLHYEAFQ